MSERPLTRKERQARTREGAAVVVERITEEAEADRQLLHFLWESGIRPGVRLAIKEVAPYAGTISVLLDGRTVINATGGGILEGPGIRQADLRAVLRVFAEIDGLRLQDDRSIARSLAPRIGFASCARGRAVPAPERCRYPNESQRIERASSGFPSSRDCCCMMASSCRMESSPSRRSRGKMASRRASSSTR